jgi:hypothetical protein
MSAFLGLACHVNLRTISYSFASLTLMLPGNVESAKIAARQPGLARFIERASVGARESRLAEAEA